MHDIRAIEQVLDVPEPMRCNANIDFYPSPSVMYAELRGTLKALTTALEKSMKANDIHSDTGVLGPARHSLGAVCP